MPPAASSSLELAAGGNNPQLTINTSGNVGIGTTNPGQKLHLYSAGGGTSTYAEIQNAGTTTNDDIAALLLVGGNTNAFWFVGTNRADIGGASENFFIYNGTTSVRALAITSAGNATLAGTLTQLSDQRLKTNIVSLPEASGLKAIEALHPVSFNWKDAHNPGSQVGFIAQEVQKVLPNLVTHAGDASTSTRDGPLALNYIGIIPPLVKAVQELDARTRLITNRANSQTQELTINTAMVNTVKNLKAVNDGQAAEIKLLRAEIVAIADKFKQQANEAHDVRVRLTALERSMAVHTAENRVGP